MFYGDMESVVSIPACTLQAHPDRHMYREFILGLDWQIRKCPMGTLFNEGKCACHDLDPNQKYSE